MPATKRSGRAHAQARALVQAIVEHAPHVIALLDRNKVIQYLSPAFERVSGFTRDEVIGRPFHEFVHPDDLDAAYRAFKANLKAHDTVTAQIRLRHKDGSWITMESYGRACLEVPELRGIVVSMADVPGQIQREAVLRQSAQESAELFEDAPCGYHSVDAGGVIRRINRTELDWLQRSREELVGRKKFADLLEPASQGRYWTLFDELKRTGRVRNAELEVQRRDGTAFPALGHSIAIRDAKGGFRESRTVLFDITERKQAELALRKFNRVLSVLGEARALVIRARTESGLLGEICELLVQRGGYQLAAVHFAQQDAQSTMRLVAKAGVDRGYLEAASMSWADSELGRGPMGNAMRTGRPQVNPDSRTNPKMAPWRELALRSGILSAVSLPLKDHVGVFGTLTVWAAEADAFDADDLRLLEQLAEDLSFAVGSLLAQKFADEHAALKRGATETPEEDPLRALSPREREIIKLVAEGRSSKEIAARLGIAPASVATYRSRLMYKLQVNNVAGLVRFALRKGIITA